MTLGKRQIHQLVTEERWDELQEVVGELRSKYPKISLPTHVQKYLLPYTTKRQEYVVVLLLDGEHKVIRKIEVGKGIVNRAIIHPREVFSEAIRERCTAVILVHNHPSGSIEPSPEDRDITKRIKQAGEILGITLLDHMIVSKTGYYSFVEQGAM